VLLCASIPHLPTHMTVRVVQRSLWQTTAGTRPHGLRSHALQSVGQHCVVVLEGKLSDEAFVFQKEGKPEVVVGPHLVVGGRRATLEGWDTRRVKLRVRAG